MKKILSFLLVAISLLPFQETAYAIDAISETPLETAILKFPDNTESNWKEIIRYVNKKEGIVERIPIDQTKQNWSELICVQYYDSSEYHKDIDFFNIVLHSLRDATLSAYPGNKVTWQIIEKDQNSVIFEWILHQPYMDIPAQHEISRAILTDTGFHRVGFTRKNEEMSVEEREKWIKILKENTAVVSFEGGVNSSSLSLVEKTKDSLSFPTCFQNWKLIDVQTEEHGFSSVCYLPPSQIETYITECLEVITHPNRYGATIEQAFEIEEKCLRDSSQCTFKLRVLQKSPDEIIYSYLYPKGHLLLNAVVRSFLTDHGYYSITYKRVLSERMQKEEIYLWKDRLEAIKISSKA